MRAGPPARIVSLVPSWTELLFALGVGPRVVACTDYCIHPASDLAGLPRVGGQKDPDLDRLIALAPELVILAREENLRRDADRLAAVGIPLLVTDVKTVDEAVEAAAHIAEAVGVDGTALASAMRRGAAAARTWAAGRPRRRVLAAVWRDPWMFAGGDTYVSDVLVACGGDNVLADRRRYPKLSLGEARALAPDLVVLPSEPYPFGPADVADVAGVAPGVLMDGTVLCWYGPRTARIGEIGDTLFAGTAHALL